MTGRGRVALVVGLGWLVALALGLTAGAQAEGRQQNPIDLVQPAWSADGKRVAWAAEPETGSGAVWVSGASGRNARRLHTFGPSVLGADPPVGQITWRTPTSLLVDAQLHGDGRRGLFRLNLAGRVIALAADPAGFSTDRSRNLVAIGSSVCPGCKGSIRILNLATRRVRRVGSPNYQNHAPALSPDGRRVVWERARGIWIAASSGRGTHHWIARSGYCPVWSPNGRMIAYISRERPRLKVLKPGGKAHTISPRETTVDCYAPSLPEFSPDSRFIAYHVEVVRTAAVSRIEVLDTRTGHVVLRSPQNLIEAGYDAWSPDGKKLLVSARATPYACASLYVATVQTRSWALFKSCG